MSIPSILLTVAHLWSAISRMAVLTHLMKSTYVMKNSVVTTETFMITHAHETS